jgi:osmoprotectant transport system substrate-binding protein
MRGKTLWFTTVLTTLALALGLMLAACNAGGSGGGRKVVVSSKNFTESILVGEMYAQVLENAGVPVERKLNLGSTAIAHEALLKGGANGGIDLYPEYTSTGLLTVLKAGRIDDPEQVYQAVKKGYKERFNLTWLDRSPMNDTQAMVTTQEVSAQRGIKSLQDLCDKAGELTVAARAEFATREDALPALQKLYGGCNFKSIRVVESDLLYKALVNKEVDVAQADSTAGEIAGYNLVLLADPKGYGSPYNIAPVVRDDVLAAYPQIADALNKLAPKITNQEISALNWEVAGKGREYADVAKEWLRKQGLIR